MSKKGFTAAERNGLILLAILLVAATVAIAISHRRDAIAEEPAMPVAVDSLIHELPEADVELKPTASGKATERDYLSDPF